jgi:hypothetical protein
VRSLQAAARILGGLQLHMLGASTEGEIDAAAPHRQWRALSSKRWQIFLRDPNNVAFAIPPRAASLDCHSSGCNDPTRRNEGRKSDENNVRHREDGSMNCTEKFRRFAAECRAMAEFTRSPESKATWDHLAARWVQCAESIDLKSSAAMLDRMARQHRRPVRGREAA